eukprot:TRINITY_DN4212_c0_g3_i2.p1 TRINITY_DN4212_c0_g3~~TRINITY_DN4212_c0_g3_i2.p1  ORF type:complete len:156 (+),score=15.48 TRINITY_DN4212_c0_g3_i2:232-699(+)
MKDVVTPFELELALTPGREWTGDYTTDFRQILPSVPQARFASRADNTVPVDEEESEVRFSVVTGKLKKVYRKPAASSQSQSSSEESSDRDLIAQGSTALTLAGSSDNAIATYADRLALRSWRGLDPEYGMTPIATIEPGLTGIAKSYQSEPHNNN